MDIIKIDFSGEELPVWFPFEALVEAVAEQNIDKFLASYFSLKYQIRIFKIGLKYGKAPAKTDAQLLQLVKDNPRSLYHVMQAFKVEFNIFASGYFDLPTDIPEEEEPTQPVEKKEGGKSLASGK